MRNAFLLLIFLCVGCVGAIAQNKTLGVGIATPNPNAALHVESPTNNQGMIIPRLTTAQRNTMTGILTTADAGLMLYDTNAKAVFTWNGIAWQSSAKIQYPTVDTVTSIPPSGAALGITYIGSTAGNFGVANFQNINPNNGFSPLFVTTNSNTNGATDMIISNPNNINDVVGAQTNGKGTAGRFTVNNTNNRFAAVYATTNGQMGLADSSAAILGVTSTAFSAVTGKVTGPIGSNGVTGISSSSNAFSFAVLGSNTGGGVGGNFGINNPANTSNALEAQTNGLGGAAKFKVTNVASTKPALWAETNSNQPLSAPIFGLNTGTGDVAASFKINNAANNFPAVYAETNGKLAGRFVKTAGTGPTVYIDSQTGGGLFANHNGPTGYSGIIQTINTSNTTPALYAESAGSGASIWALKSTDAVSGDALLAENMIPTGSAGKFVISDATNPNPTIVTTTNSTANGSAILATNTGVGDAVFANANSGSGGNFQNSNASNNASTVFAMTNAPSGHSIGTMNTANGSAFSIFQGGMKVSTTVLSAGGSITTRAVAYQITGGSTYTFSLTPALTDGEMFYMYNSSASPVTVAGANIGAGSGLLFIVLGGTPRPF